MNPEIKAINEKIIKESEFVEKIIAEVSKVIVGQNYMIERLLIGLLSNGHILLEGVPGLAKTLTVSTLSQTIKSNFQRIQFTPDLLPADLIGTLIYNTTLNFLDAYEKEEKPDATDGLVDGLQYLVDIVTEGTDKQGTDVKAQYFNEGEIKKFFEGYNVSEDDIQPHVEKYVADLAEIVGDQTGKYDPDVVDSSSTQLEQLVVYVNAFSMDLVNNGTTNYLQQAIDLYRPIEG